MLYQKIYGNNCMKKEFIAYEGEQFTVEWYFDKRGRSEVLKYFQNLPPDRAKKASRLITVIAQMGKIFNEEKFRYEGDQIYAIKPSEDRFLCFFYRGSKIIITNAYEKKSNKMPVKEKERALQ